MTPFLNAFVTSLKELSRSQDPPHRKKGLLFNVIKALSALNQVLQAAIAESAPTCESCGQPISSGFFFVFVLVFVLRFMSSYVWLLCRFLLMRFHRGICGM